MISALIIFTGLVLGISMAAPPGPVMTMIMKKSLRSVTSGFLVGMGAMTADIILLAIVIFLRKIVNLTKFEPITFLLGGIYFIYLALKIGTELKNKNVQESPENIKDFSYFKGLITGILNPMQIGWWLTAGLSILEAEGISPFYFFYVGIVIYVYFLCLLIYRSHKKFQERVSLFVNVFSVFVLLGFGAYFIFSFFTLWGWHF